MADYRNRGAITPGESEREPIEVLETQDDWSREQVGVLREAMQLAGEQRDITERQVKAGTLAKIEITAAEAEFQRRQEQYLGGLEAVTVAENALKQLLAGSRKASIWAQEIVPQKLAMPAVQVASLDQAVAEALQNRPELKEIQLQIEQNQIDIEFLRNQLRPQVDLVAGYGKHGLAGTPRVGASPFGSQAPPGFFTGGYGDSLAMLFNRDFRSAEVGLVLSFRCRIGGRKASMREQKRANVACWGPGKCWSKGSRPKSVMRSKVS